MSENDPSLEELDQAVRVQSHESFADEIETLDAVILELNHGTALVSGTQHDRGLNLLVGVLLNRAFTTLWRAREDVVAGYPVQALLLARSAFEDWLTTKWVELNPESTDRWLWAILSEVEEPSRRPPPPNVMMKDLADLPEGMKSVYDLLSKFAHPRGHGLRWHLSFDEKSTTFRYGPYFDEHDAMLALWLLVQIAQAFLDRAAQLQQRMLGAVDEGWKTSALAVTERAETLVGRGDKVLMPMDVD